MPAGYRPCSFLVVPKELGKRGVAKRRGVTKAGESKGVVAYLQHRVALAVCVELCDNAPALLARRGGAPWREDSFRRKLNGQIPRHLTELMELVFELGPSILPFGVQRATLLPRPKSE